ncbi:hypothetical protein [Rubritalea tangerina]|uniref:hypothetical protein n=1 Tax=Rubritalea tangerina TaxID=430798 RepID=UPI00361901F8
MALRHEVTRNSILKFYSAVVGADSNAVSGIAHISLCDVNLKIGSERLSLCWPKTQPPNAH